ncbi:MAG: preprotein translocase subunit SecG [Bacteroidales bacterium]|jgi:preprotein translocase subunit SecG|nr:preprotein translocase subunit SecG [Bacteroidales bacterium]
MSTAFLILTIFIVIASVLLTIVVLLQSGKDGGLASNFVAANQTFGVRQTADYLEKVTWGLVAFILVLSIVTSFTLGGGRSTMDVTDKIDQASQQVEFPTAPVLEDAPATEAPATETPAE